MRAVHALCVAAICLCVLPPSAVAGARSSRDAGITWGSGTRGDIRGANVDGSGRHVVVPLIADGEGDPAWTRDGRALAYFTRNSDTVEIHVLWPSTRKERRLGSDFRSPREPPRAFAYILEPTWSPDGKRIAVSDSWTNTEATIRIVSVTTGKWTSVTKPRRHEEDVDPAWSPDGRTIAFARRLNGGTPTIYLAHPDGSGLRRLTKGRSPSWSPDGNRLAFVLGGSANLIRADGRGRRPILRGLRKPVVRWSPDGRRLLYTSGNDAWTADLDGMHRKRVLHNEVIWGIAWRPGSA